MKNIKTFTKTSFVSGLLVLLPITILFMIMRWVFLMITDAIQPMTNFVMGTSQSSELISDMIVIGMLIFVCFIIGTIVRTQLGEFLHKITENSIFNVAPGYSTIKEIVNHFLGNRKNPFSTVALAQIFCNETLATVFITDEHPDGTVTVFMPTGPNPTSGNIYHLEKKYVHPIEVSVEDTMRSIISCGVGSTKLIDAYISQKN